MSYLNKIDCLDLFHDTDDRVSSKMFTLSVRLQTIAELLVTIRELAVYEQCCPVERIEALAMGALSLLDGTGDLMRHIADFGDSQEQRPGAPGGWLDEARAAAESQRQPACSSAGAA